MSKQKTDLELLIEYRADARDNKNFKIADLIRDTLKSMDIILEDSKEGTTWKYRND